MSAVGLENPKDLSEYQNIENDLITGISDCKAKRILFIALTALSTLVAAAAIASAIAVSILSGIGPIAIGLIFLAAVVSSVAGLIIFSYHLKKETSQYELDRTFNKLTNADSGRLTKKKIELFKIYGPFCHELSLLSAYHEVGQKTKTLMAMLTQNGLDDVLKKILEEKSITINPDRLWTRREKASLNVTLGILKNLYARNPPCKEKIEKFEKDLTQLLNAEQSEKIIGGSEEAIEIIKACPNVKKIYLGIFYSFKCVRNFCLKRNISNCDDDVMKEVALRHWS